MPSTEVEQGLCEQECYWLASVIDLPSINKVFLAIIFSKL